MKSLKFFTGVSFFILNVCLSELYAQWQKIPELDHINVYCMLTTSNQNTFVGGDNGTLLRSTDNGLTWGSIMGGAFWADTVLSLGQGLGYVFAGANGAGSVYRTSDNGESWEYAGNGIPQNAQIYSFTFANKLLFVATQYGVFSSADSGKSWGIDTAGLGLDQVYPSQNDGMAGIVASGTKLYSIKWNGGIVYSSSVDSVFWEQISSDYYNAGLSIVAVDTNIFIATQKGIYGYAGGTSWLPKNNGLFVSETSWLSSCIFTLSDTIIFANILSEPYSTSGIYVTSDLGENWIKIKDSVFTGASINTITANANYLFASTQNGSWRMRISDFITSSKDYLTELPNEFYLFQNYPNPFNPSTIISYSIPKESRVRLNVYDILGREVATLVNEEKTAGNYSANFNGNNLSSGIYFYSLQKNNKIITKKMLLIK